MALPNVQLALEVAGRVSAVVGNEDLLRERLGAERGAAEVAVVDRHLTPAKDTQLVVLGRALDELALHRLDRRILVDEHHTHAVLALARQRDAHALGDLHVEVVRHADEHAWRVVGR